MVIYENEMIVAIVTGVTGARSANRKTGDMAQLWILRRDMHPMDAIRTGNDNAICGDCPLRGVNGKGRACYVNVGQAPSVIWKKYRDGGYARVDVSTVAAMLRGRRIRLGAYGDPSFLPFELVSELVSQSDGWTGYTHQWRRCDQRFAGILMASADDIAGRREARAGGWRSFYVVPASVRIDTVAGAVECAATRERNPLQCADCLMCAGTRHGTRTNAVDVVIAAHGAGAKYVTA